MDPKITYIEWLKKQEKKKAKKDAFDEQNTEDAAGKGTYRSKPVPGGGGPKSTYTPEKD